MKSTCSTSHTNSRRRWLQNVLALGTSVAALEALRAADPDTGFIVRPLGFVRLPNGRKLAYAEYGDPHAQHIIIHHHGIPSCRLDGDMFVETLRCRRGVRLYVLDRPGIGCSDPDQCKSFLNWPTDVRNFADALGIDKFGVLGASGGTPYALAVARALPERVTAVGLACPMAPLEAVGSKTGSGALGSNLAVRHPVLSRIILGNFANAERRRPNRMPLLGRIASTPDHQLLLDPTERRYLAHIVDEAFRQGAPQVVHEAALLQTPWDCWLPEVKAKVHILEGSDDRIAPPVMARYLAGRLPNAQLTMFPGEAHLSLGRRHAGAMLNAATPSQIQAVAQTK